jgi:hypothetical protein
MRRTPLTVQRLEERATPANLAAGLIVTAAPIMGVHAAAAASSDEAVLPNFTLTSANGSTLMVTSALTNNRFTETFTLTNSSGTVLLSGKGEFTLNYNSQTAGGAFTLTGPNGKEYLGTATADYDAGGVITQTVSVTGPNNRTITTEGKFTISSNKTISGTATLTGPKNKELTIEVDSIFDGQPRGFGVNFTNARVAAGDFNGDNVTDVAYVTGPGGGAYLAIVDGFTGEYLLAGNKVNLFPGENLTNIGLFVAAADVDGDGKAEVAVSADQGGGPRVKIYSMGLGSSLEQKQDFMAIDDPEFRGGARVALGDVNGDGKADLVVSAGFQGGPRVAIYDGNTLFNTTPVKLVGDFFAFEPGLRNGVYVGVGDLDGDGKAELVFGAGPGGGPRVLAVRFDTLKTDVALALSQPYANFFALAPDSRAGVRISVADTDGDGKADILTGTGGNGNTRVRVYAGKRFKADGSPTDSADDAGTLVDPALAGAVFVG